MEWAKGIVTKGVLVGMDVSNVLALTRDKLEELVVGVRGIVYKSREVKSQSGEG